MVKPVGDAPETAGLEYYVKFPAGAEIFERGDAGDEMYIVQSGSVEIVLPTDDGELQLAVLEGGDFFGEMAILEGEPRTAGARAVEDCALLPVKGATFTKMLQENPEIAVRMMRKLSARIRDLKDRLTDALDHAASEPAKRVEVSEAPPEQQQAPPPPVGAPARERFVHESTGTELPLAAGEETTIGRPDSSAGTTPDIDLTPLNKDRTVSRRHAKVLRRSGRFFVIEETGTVNGTFINGQRIEAGVPAEFKEGDSLAFGAVKTRFRVA